MGTRLRKFTGLIVLLVGLFVYVLLAMGIAARILPNAHWAVELLFYALAGVAWIVPARYLITWMSRLEQA